MRRAAGDVAVSGAIAEHVDALCSGFPRLTTLHKRLDLVAPLLESAMKFLNEVVSDYPPPEKLPLNGPVDAKIFLVLSEDEKSMTPSGVQIPGLGAIPSLSLVRITRQE